jgi:hypothetical protein
VRQATITALVLACVLLAACGGDDEPQSTQTVQVTIPSTTSTGIIPATTTSTTEQTTNPDAPPTPGSGDGAPDAIAAATAVLTSEGTPDQACGSYVTENFIQTSFGGEENCIAAREGQPLAAGISVQSGDETATHLVVIPSGGPYGAARVEVDLVEEDGQFRVDALKAHVPAGP